MADTSNLTRFLSDVADAIREKKNTNDRIKASEFDNEIENLSSGELVSKDVDFVDYDGTLLYSYTLKEIEEMTELPALPTQPGLICQEWNWSLEDIKAFGRRLIVGATYITDDGKTRIYIDLTSEDRLEMPLYLYQTEMYGVEIDWGDGSPIETTNYTYGTDLQHKYSSTGRYVITLNPINDNALSFGNGSSNTNILGSISGNNRYRHYYSNTIYKIEIGKNITSIVNYIFDYCCSLTSITIPNTITRIGTDAFRNCYKLEGLIIPNSVTNQLYSPFNKCYALNKISIPNSITEVLPSICNKCYSLEEIIFTDNMVDISSNMLEDCIRLREVILPYGMTSLGSQFFIRCYSLKKVTLPNSITTIKTNAFRECTGLEKIEIPNSVTNIEDSVFYNCYLLNEVTMPNTVASIGYEMFYNCYSLEEVVLPDGITDIKKHFCYNCYSLTKIKIPSGVTNIATYAFGNCYSVIKYDFSEHTQVPTLENKNAFANISTDCKIIVPDALYDEWIAATNWSNYADYIIKVSEVYMSIMEEIMPAGETCDGLGGTEEEIASVADEILGNK